MYIAEVTAELRRPSGDGAWLSCHSCSPQKCIYLLNLLIFSLGKNKRVQNCLCKRAVGAWLPWRRAPRSCSGMVGLHWGAPGTCAAGRDESYERSREEEGEENCRAGQNRCETLNICCIFFKFPCLFLFFSGRFPIFGLTRSLNPKRRGVGKPGLQYLGSNSERKQKNRPK